MYSQRDFPAISLLSGSCKSNAGARLGTTAIGVGTMRSPRCEAEARGNERPTGSTIVELFTGAKLVAIIDNLSDLLC